MNELNIKAQQDQLEKCQKILDMISLNKIYLDSHEQEAFMPPFSYMKQYYELLAESRRKIHSRLQIYYAKEIAKLISEPFEVAQQLKRAA